MANQIHSTAVIGPQVVLGDNIIIGPYAVIDGEVVLGDGNEIGSHVTILGTTKIGGGNRFFPHASIGQDPQDKKHQRGDKTFLEIGNNNIFREFTTMNRGTLDGGGVTRIADRNLFMAYAHVAHDCQVGSDCVLANSVALAGHVMVEDRAIIGGLVGVHQFVRIGRQVMVGGVSKLSQDVPPYCLCDGNPPSIYGLNIVGLKRAQVPLSTIKLLKEAYRILVYSGLAKSTAVERIEKEIAQLPEIQQVVAFAKASERGLIKGSAAVNGDDD